MSIPAYATIAEYIVWNEQTGTSYTIVDADMCKVVNLTNAAAIALTIPTNATLALPVGWNCTIKNGGAGLVTVGGSGITFENTPGLKLRAQGSGALLVKRLTNTWWVSGDLST